MTDHPKDDSKRTPAEELRELISKAGISQRGAARELEVDERTMRYWCGDADRPPPRMAIRALDPRVRHYEFMKRTVANNEEQIALFESGQMTEGYGPGPASAEGAAARVRQLRQDNEELRALIKQEDAVNRRREAFFVVNGQFLPHGNGLPEEEALNELDAAMQECREAEAQVDRIVKEIRAGRRR